MDAGEFRRDVERAVATHDGGMKLLACLKLDPAWFAEIVREVESLVDRRPPSDVGDKSHPTYWTGPYGQATQHSLFNSSGMTHDTSVDHNHQLGGKRFNAPECPALHRFARCFESRLLNMRINGLQTGAGLSPHEEFVVHGEKLRLRFHLPIVTSEKATVLLDDERFYFRPGYVYYFNNGCVHGVENLGKATRYHLVFDMYLDDWLWDNVVDPTTPETPDPGMRKLSPNEQAELAAGEYYPIDEYVIGTPTGVVLRATRQVSATGETSWLKVPINQ